MQLAEVTGSSQRALSRYETVDEFLPAAVLVALAKALRVSTDELLGLKAPLAPPSPTPSLWKKFRRVLTLSEKDRRAIIRMINLLSSRPIAADCPA